MSPPHSAMAKYLSSAPITHLFDQLPTDMIYYEIFPYLDYNSRVTANLLLPSKDRLSVPLRKDAALQFHLHLAGRMFKNILDKQRNAKSNLARNRLSLKVWRAVLVYPQLFQYNSRLREVVKDKALEFSDPRLEELTRISPYTCKELKKLCETFLLSLETSVPFVRDIPPLVTTIEDWSAIVE
jgi:hypothetical protein